MTMLCPMLLVEPISTPEGPTDQPIGECNRYDSVEMKAPQQATRKKKGWDSQRPSLQRVPEILRPAMVEMLGTVWPEMERLLHGH